MIIPFALLLLLLSPLCWALDVFDCVQDLVNWMPSGRGSRKYGLYVGPHPGATSVPGGDPSLIWVFLEPPSERPPQGKHPRLRMSIEDFLTEIDGLDLFSRGFMEIHVPESSVVLGEALRQDLSHSLVSLMLLMQLHPRSRISFPVPRDVDMGPLFALLSPYFGGGVRRREGDGLVECVGRKWVRKAELVEALAEPSDSLTSYWPSSTWPSRCSIQ